MQLIGLWWYLFLHVQICAFVIVKIAVTSIMVFHMLLTILGTGFALVAL